MQYIVKPPGSAESGFTWHRDSDWLSDVGNQRVPYISLWCALDDMTEGAVLGGLCKSDAP